MAQRFEYTTLAHRYTAQFPVLTYVGTQVNFWILANLLLVTVLHLYSNILSQTLDIPVPVQFATNAGIAVIVGISYGLGLGLTGYYLDRTIFRKLSLGKVLALKAVIAIALFALILLVLRLFMSPSLSIAGIRLNEKSWDFLCYLLLVYYFFMSLLIAFINQVNKKYGPGVLVPLLLGRYRTPREEEKIFMFMDLKSSTVTAERLGHLKYSAFIRDCFADVNEVLYPFKAQVYQYVGDEIVVMWPVSEGLREWSCVKFFFAVVEQLKIRRGYYLGRYGLLPAFKAGMHMGKVTAVEIGEIKKDIAYHGDTLNTAARIQSICNEYGSDFLASGHVIQHLGKNEFFRLHRLGSIALKGKSENTELISIETITSSSINDLSN